MIFVKNTKAILSIALFIINSGIAFTQINHSKSDKLDIIYFGNRYSYLVPHVEKTFHKAMSFHNEFWDYHDTITNAILTDFEDMGHAGAIAMPFSQVQIGIEPYGFAFSIIPSNERFQWLFNHELTHIVMTDKANDKDQLFRKILMGKVRRNEEKPVSAFWSYKTTPRWYSPRWYQEGIACFMETWMSGGLGRAMGTYDEMYFRSIVNEKHKLYSLVGLETEGTSIDFQLGANSYLYGARFVSYLAYKYGTQKLKDFYSRTDGSKSFYAGQFKNIYGEPVRKVWNDWIKWENDFQNENIKKVSEYPLTEIKPITAKPLGNFSNFGYDAENDKIYAAINHPGVISQIVEINRQDGKIRKIATLDSPVMYYSTDLAFDKAGKRIFISENNNKIRKLVSVDIMTGSKKVLLEYARAGSFAFNDTDRCLWAVRHDNGYAVLVKIPEPYDKVIPVYTAPFGKTLFDLDVSNKGDKLSASVSGINGEQSLVLFNLQDLESGNNKFKTILNLDDNTLTQFKFSNDDKYLIGTSYYTGVSNIWRVNLSNSDFQMLSNTETGLFMPAQLNNDSLIALKFCRDGMLPCTLPVKVVEDANSITYLGNLIHQKCPEVEEWALSKFKPSKLDTLKSVTEPYIPLKKMKIANAYPDFAGFKSTVALGYRVNFRDPLGMSNMELFLATSPWSGYEDKQKIHFMFDWDYYNWHLTANYNKTHFYDLFGPTKRSRAGYDVGLNYKRTFSRNMPLTSYYDIGAHVWGDLEVLPGYQNVATPIKNIQALTATYGISKLRKTLGGVMDEKGYEWTINAAGYMAGGSVYPSIVSTQNAGFLVPGIRNTSFWIRNSIGQSLGNKNSALSKFYFGGFRNNYIDWQPSEQYRLGEAFAGAKIDELDAYNYVKTMAELNLKPLRMNNVGMTWLYPTFIKSSVFGTHMLTDFYKKSETRNIFNLGAQIDIQLVMFSYLKTTWSVGYARKFEKALPHSDELMISLKLLGD